MSYKFYKAQVTGGGYLPQGQCLATLTLDENRQPTWSEVDDEFKELCLPLFESTVRMGALSVEILKPYSEEALEHLSKRQLPSQGYVMISIKDTPKPPAKGQTTSPSPPLSVPSPYGYGPGIYVPPPGLNLKKD